YNALVYSSIISTVTLVLAGAVYRRSEFVLRPTLVEWRRITGFGSQVAFTNVLGHIAINMNDLVVGKALGFTAVGILSRAQGVMNLFHRDMMGAIKGVAYPAFAEASRRNADMEDIHNRSITALTAVAWPFYGFFALYPPGELALPVWATVGRSCTTGARVLRSRCSSGNLEPSHEYDHRDGTSQVGNPLSAHQSVRKNYRACTRRCNLR
ncbi:MAG: oligosaccharide flippase family protein, partial [Lacipirellulaceae bacterium]